jgi:hypothetical protein
MTVFDTTTDLDWLAKAEQAEAEQDAESARLDAELSAEFAQAVNDKLTKLGITPHSPASVSDGRLEPAVLTLPDAARKHFGVHASFDEDEGGVELLVSDYRQSGVGSFMGLRSSGYKLHTVREVLWVRSRGPRREKPEPAALAADTVAIVEALGSLESAVRDLRDAVACGLSRP